MFKYIVNRILISVLILFGVSVIIYTMVRMMPSDYVDIKFSSQLQQNTITQDDVDRFKELYGINMPEAYLVLEIKGGDYSGTYTANVRVQDYEAAKKGEISAEKWLQKTYKKGDLSLTLSESGTVQIGQSRAGTYTLKTETNGGEIKAEITLSVNGVTSSSLTYKPATFWNKAGSVIGGYFKWAFRLLKGDLGTSFMYEKPVAQVISENMWISFSIALIATILQFLIAIPLGISSATHQYSVRDYTVTVLTMIGISFPTYFFATIVIKIFAVQLGLLPSTGLISGTANYAPTFAGNMAKIGDMAQHLILPIFVSVVLSIGGLMRYTRTNTLEVLNADYIRTARAKGLSESKVIYKHAFRNTLIPLATLLAGILPSLFGGMMITEQVFAIDGIGNLAYKALKGGDIPFVMGYNMFLAVLTVIGTLLSDIMYSIVDPRVKLGR